MKVRLAICDERLPREAELSLMREGFRVITLPPSRFLSEAVASHTDMLLFRLGNEYISFADYCDEAPFLFTDLASLLSGAKITLTADRVAPEYPADAKMNGLLMGDRLFANPRSISPYILEKCAERGIEHISVKQGYPACTVMRLGDGAAVTADEGMARAMSENGIKVTLIKNGGIMLPPYEYGFIGGCCGVFENKVYLTGDLNTHPDAEKIKRAVAEAGLIPVSLSGGRLLDLGGILFAEGEL